MVTRHSPCGGGLVNAALRLRHRDPEASELIDRFGSKERRIATQDIGKRLRRASPRNPPRAWLSRHAQKHLRTARAPPRPFPRRAPRAPGRSPRARRAAVVLVAIQCAHFGHAKRLRDDDRLSAPHAGTDLVDQVEGRGLSASAALTTWHIWWLRLAAALAARDSGLVRCSQIWLWFPAGQEHEWQSSPGVMTRR